MWPYTIEEWELISRPLLLTEKDKEKYYESICTSNHNVVAIWPAAGKWH